MCLSRTGCGCERYHTLLSPETKGGSPAREFLDSASSSCYQRTKIPCCHTYFRASGRLGAVACRVVEAKEGPCRHGQGKSTFEGCENGGERSGCGGGALRM